MIDPISKALLASAVSNLPGMVLGGSQLMKSNRMNPVRPEYEIPESEKRALGVAEGLASQTRLPGQSAIEGRLDQTTANSLATIERMGYGGASDINAASRAFGNQQDKETELGVAAAGFNIQNQKNLEGALSRMATYEDKQWQINEQQPFLDDSRAKAALYEGGMENLVGGFKDTAGGVSNILLADAMKTGGYKQQQLPDMPYTYTPPVDNTDYEMPQAQTPSNRPGLNPYELTEDDMFSMMYLPNSPLNRNSNRYKSIMERPN